jgi:hypothetical protein
MRCGHCAQLCMIARSKTHNGHRSTILHLRAVEANPSTLRQSPRHRHSAAGQPAQRTQRHALEKGSHSPGLDLLISLPELLFHLLQRFGKTIVKRRSGKGSGVHRPKPFSFTVFLVDATNRLFAIRDGVIILRILPAHVLLRACLFAAGTARCRLASGRQAFTARWNRVTDWRGALRHYGRLET